MPKATLLKSWVGMTLDWTLLLKKEFLGVKNKVDIVPRQKDL